MGALLHGLGQVVLPFLAMLSAIVLIHELGHYAAARLFGLAVSRFSVGFGPALLRWHAAAGTEWRLSAIPLGGYVHVSFDERRLARAVVIAAGPLANVLLAAALLFANQLTSGVRDAPPVVAQVQADSPAAVAGLRPGDRIRTMNGRPVRGFGEILSYAALHLDAPLTLAVERGGVPLDVTLRPFIIEVSLPGGRIESVGITGLLPGPAELRHPPAREALAAAWQDVAHMLQDTLAGLTQVITGTRAYTSLVGIVGLADMTGSIVERSGFAALLGFAALISLNVAVVNALPLPILDGGQLLLVLIETALRRPLPGRLVGAANAAGLVLLSSVLLLTTWNDLAVLL